MKTLTLVWLILCGFTVLRAQSEEARKIYQTERAFEKAVAEKGINQGFIEYLSADGIIFRPDPVNGRNFLKSQPASPASLTWNPEYIDVSSNGALAYSIGNAKYRAQGKDDPAVSYIHYVSIWQRQPNGTYRAALDTGFSHEKPAKTETEWKSPVDSKKELNEKKSAAADTATGFFETAEKQSLEKAYKTFLADDARIFREGKMPFVGKDAALGEIKSSRSKIKFTKRSVFSGAADMAYFTNGYTLFDKSGREIEKGNFVQIWKLRGGKWQIVVDIFNPSK